MTRGQAASFLLKGLVLLWFCIVVNTVKVKREEDFAYRGEEHQGSVAPWTRRGQGSQLGRGVEHQGSVAPWTRRKEGAPARGTSDWEIMRDQILAASGKLPNSPNLGALKQALQHPHYSGKIDEYVNESGSTPLMFCVGPVNEDSLSMLDELVLRNANPTAKNMAGQSAVGFAKAWHDKAMQEHGRDPIGETVLQRLYHYGGNPEEPPVFSNFPHTGTPIERNRDPEEPLVSSNVPHTGTPIEKQRSVLSTLKGIRNFTTSSWKRLRNFTISSIHAKLTAKKT